MEKIFLIIEKGLFFNYTPKERGGKKLIINNKKSFNQNKGNIAFIKPTQNGHAYLLSETYSYLGYVQVGSFVQKNPLDIFLKEEEEYIECK